MAHCCAPVDGLMMRYLCFSMCGGSSGRMSSMRKWRDTLRRRYSMACSMHKHAVQHLQNLARMPAQAGLASSQRLRDPSELNKAVFMLSQETVLPACSNRCCCPPGARCPP